MVLGIKEGLVECATVCIKSVVILTTVTEDTKKCTDPKLKSLVINRLNFYPDTDESKHKQST